MNQAEIMTLLSNKTGMRKDAMRKSIRLAIMAGKLSGILNSADREISKAENFSKNADWSEMLRIMEGTLDKEVDHLAYDEREKLKAKKADY
jgi:hypothetical protein